jgi:hypothetical protein
MAQVLHRGIALADLLGPRLDQGGTDQVIGPVLEAPAASGSGAAPAGCSGPGWHGSIQASAPGWHQDPEIRALLPY